MADYFDELGHTPTGPEGANDFDRHYRRLQVLAIMNGIDMEIEVPEASKRAIEALPIHEITAEEVDPEIECVVCKQPAEAGEKFKVLPCKHEFHEECILLWLKKVLQWIYYNYNSFSLLLYSSLGKLLSHLPVYAGKLLYKCQISYNMF